MIVMSSIPLLIISGLAAFYVPPGDFFQNKEDHFLFLNICDTILQRDIEAASGEAQDRKKGWWMGWREHIATQVDGFSFYEGASSDGYWQGSHQFTSRSTQAYALLESFTLEFLAYTGEEGRLRLDPQVRLRTLESICPSLGIDEKELSKLHDSLVRIYGELSKSRWEKLLDTLEETDKFREEWYRENPMVSGPLVFPAWEIVSGVQNWFGADESAEPSNGTSEEALYALEKTKEVVLYETLIEDQKDRALAQELIQRQAQEQEILRRQIEEQKATLDALRAANEEAERQLALSGAGAFGVLGNGSDTEEILREEGRLKRLQAMLTISMAAQGMESKKQGE